MRESLELLIRLQEIDLELQHIEDSKGDLPQRVGILKGEIENINTTLETKRSDLLNVQRSKRHLEGEVQLLEEKRKKYLEQRHNVKTTKEYDAINIEIDVTEKKIEEGETKILELIEAEEKLLQEIKENEEVLGNLSAELLQKEKELEEKLQQTKKIGEALSRNRREIVVKITRPILASYERIRKAKDGVAIVTIKRGACGGCFSTIPPQKTLEIRKMNRIILCEVCGRILVWKDEEQESQPAQGINAVV